MTQFDFDRAISIYLESDAAIFRALPSLMPTNAIFVDIGAREGVYTYVANELLRNAVIYAIEPDPVAFVFLENKCREWQRLSSNRIIALNKAVSNECGCVPFFRPTNMDVSGGLWKHQTGLDSEEARSNLQWERIEVESVTLDSLFARHVPDLVKIDVEGAELRVLKGSRKLLSAHSCKFLVELHPWGDERGGKPADVVDFMRANGYRGKPFHGPTLFEYVSVPAWRRSASWLRATIRKAIR